MRVPSACIGQSFFQAKTQLMAVSSSVLVGKRLSKMIWCVAYGCKNWDKDRKRRSVSFHRFPKDPRLRNRWVAALKLKNLPEHFGDAGYVCSDHFLAEDFKRDLQAELLGGRTHHQLKDGAVPSVFSFSKPPRKPPSSRREHSRVSVFRLFWYGCTDCPWLCTTAMLPAFLPTM